MRKGRQCYKCKRHYSDGIDFTYRGTVCDDCCHTKVKKGRRCSSCKLYARDGITFVIRPTVCDNCVQKVNLWKCPRCNERKPSANFINRKHCGCWDIERLCPLCNTKQPAEHFGGRRHCGCKLLMKKCSRCNELKTKATFQNKFTCADCIIYKRCYTCKKDKPAKTFINSQRCGDCLTYEELDEPGKLFCSACSMLKELKEFPWVPSQNKHRRQCFDCKREMDRKYAKENSEARAEASRKWLEQYMTLPLDQITHGTQQSYVLKKCRCDDCKKYYEETMKPKQLAYMRANPEATRARFHRRRHQARVSLTEEDIKLSVAYRKAIKNDMCFFCGINPGEEDEHWLAIDNGGTDHWYNLTRACWTCNRGPGGKHTKLAIDFYYERLDAGLPINPRFETRVLQEQLDI